jgi:hypothetical protein
MAGFFENCLTVLYPLTETTGTEIYDNKGEFKVYITNDKNQ